MFIIIFASGKINCAPNINFAHQICILSAPNNIPYKIAFKMLFLLIIHYYFEDLYF